MASLSKKAPAPSPAQPGSRDANGPQSVAILWATALMAIAGLASTVSQLALSPVYGSIPAAIWHQKSLMFIALVVLINKSAFQRVLPANIHTWIPVLAFWILPIQSLLFQYSAVLGPDYGPVVTEVLTFYPFLLLSLFSAVSALQALDLSLFSRGFAEGIPPLACYTTFSTIEKFVAGRLPAFMGSNHFFTRSGLQLLVAALSAAVAPSKFLLLALPAVFHTLRFNPHFPGATTTAVLNETLRANHYTLLERQESLTGYVSVIESHENQFRLLRCDHSLLGGEWLVTPERAAAGQTQRESIYTVFTMLEAVRLVITGSVNNQRQDSEKSALNIGLGIGTAPTALLKHGINTTIVELDPAVHRMATKHFALPTNHTAVLRDAVQYVSETAATSPASFDYIIHDVFTGGAEPTALFTLDFMQGLRQLLRPDGVVAINYAGDLRLNSTRLVLNTIHAVFPSCRIFRDQAKQESESEDEMDFINMILFCRPVKNTPIRFRQPVDADYLGSIVRRRTLYPAADLEVKFKPDEGAELLTEENVAVLEKGHKESAVSHWRIMRTVLPDKIWELW
ncbi:Spermine synthase [Macrophomina phaseolina MS6]|uniref:Spermine synthase n=2 Tax=Macrophomina phaseolina TaxID=35725 RepID=K2RYH3_MACPH|nr:Spermine synthase [Macrophomina phaseolina MS6]KAH7044002.1 S-adenosyl-L-methionine-dependent methyltransferase [Macrophomina phaseolina]